MEGKKDSGRKRKPEIAILAGAALVALGCWFLSSEDRGEAAAESVRTNSRLIAEAKPRIAKAREAEDRTVSDGEPPESAQAPLFAVGGRRFRSLQDAVDAAEPGATVTLEGNAYMRNPVAIRKALTLNLNGFRLLAKNSALAGGRGCRKGVFAEGAHALTVFGDQQVTVENGFIDVESNDGTGGFTGAVETVPDPGAAASRRQGPKNDDWKFDVVLRDLEVTSDAARDGVFRNADCKMLIDNCSVHSTGGNGSYTLGKGSETTIRGSEFLTTGTDGDLGYWNNTVAVAYDGHTTVESGTYVTQMAEGVEGTTYGTYVYSSGGTIDVKDGEFQADHVVEVNKDVSKYGEEYGVAEVVIQDGTLSGKLNTWTSGETDESQAGVSAYGGVYDNAPAAEQVPNGREVVDYGDGTYSVEKSSQQNYRR